MTKLSKQGICIIILAAAMLVGFWAGYIYSGPVAQAAPTAKVSVDPQPAPKYTAADLETLAIIIYQEAGSSICSDAMQDYVGCVVLNRVESSKYPNSIQSVATQKRQWGRLYWTGIVWPARASNPGEAAAVKRARAAAKRVLEMTNRPVPKNVLYCAEFKQGKVWKHEGDMYFCY